MRIEHKHQYPFYPFNDAWTIKLTKSVMNISSDSKIILRTVKMIKETATIYEQQQTNSNKDNTRNYRFLLDIIESNFFPSPKTLFLCSDTINAV